MKASKLPAIVPWKGVSNGKSALSVLPVTNTLPGFSTVMPLLTFSEPDPPRYVEKSSAEPSAVICVTNTSCGPDRLPCSGSKTGKLGDVVKPVT